MNVCMIAYTFYEGDNRVMRYAETLAARGDSVDVISLAHQGQQRVEILSSGVRVIRIQSRIKNERTKGAYLFRVMRFLVRALFVTSAQHLRSPYDFVHVHSVPDFLVFAAILPRLTGAKIVLDIHDLLPELYGSKFASQERSRVFALMKLIERVSSAFVDHVIAPNHIWQERLIGRSVPREKCSVFMNYPDPAVFRKRGRSRGDNRLVMIYPGTLNWHQGVDIAIRAFATVASRVPDSEFHIYGEGPSKLDLVRLTHELGLNGKVLFFDSVGLREIAGKIENADLGVVPKRNDPFGDEAFSTKTLEFMMLGVPLIVADTTVDRRYFNHDVVTFFKAGDACSLAEFMLRFFEDANLRSSQATRARIFVEAYSWETRKKEYLSLIDQLVGVTGAPGISHPKVASRVERGGMTRNRDGDVQVIAAVEPVAVERKIRESDISKHTSDLVKNSIQKVVRWVENHNYKAYDPGDGDLSFLRHFTFNTAFLRRALTAAILRTPFHIRPWVGIRPHTSTKGMGYMGWGYVKMYASGREEKYRRQADFCFDWLIEHRSPGEEQYCWGNHFSFSTRAGTIPRYTPTIVWSSLIGLAFLEAYEVLGNPRYLDVAESTAEWVKRLPREQTSRGTCLSYVPFRQVSIHNSNMLGAGLLARIGVCTNDREAVELAKDAMIYSCSRQNNDGAWFYGEDPHYHWIDSFHTGYNLDSLKRYLDTTGDSGFEQNFQRGIQYFKRNFFREDGSPKYYHDKAGPIDIQCAAQSIDSLAFLSDSDTESLELAAKIAHWTIDNMQAPDGHFYYRDLGWKKIKTPMLHWGQGTMFKALAHLLSKTTYRSIESSQEGLEIAASEAADLVD